MKKQRCDDGYGLLEAYKSAYNHLRIYEVEPSEELQMRVQGLEEENIRMKAVLKKYEKFIQEFNEDMKPIVEDYQQHKAFKEQLEKMDIPERIKLLDEKIEYVGKKLTEAKRKAKT